jgi:phosphoribosylglycinamide formyltransferase-1
MNLAFFASHQGSNMQAVIDACKSGALPAKLCAVVSNNRDSEALARARREGIPAYHLSSKTHPDPDALDQAILQAVQEQQAELIILAGFMCKLGPDMLAAYRNRILNIHPSLLPKYGGKGMCGRAVHEAVLRGGEKETGVSIHLVDEEYDHGAVIAQRRVTVDPQDTVDSLAARVLAVEHAFLVDTLRKIMAGAIPLPATKSSNPRRPWGNAL